MTTPAPCTSYCFEMCRGACDPSDQRRTLRLLLGDSSGSHYCDADLDALVRARGLVGAYRALRRLDRAPA